MNRMPDRRQMLWLLMLCAEILVIIYALLANNSLVDSLQTMARLSGRVSLILFCLIFVHYHPGDRVKNAFFVFAVAHGTHLIELVAYQLSKNPTGQFITTRAAGGFVAYVLIFIMPLLHQLEDRGRIKYSNVMKLEFVYIYFIWFIFFMTYLPRIMGKATSVGGSYYEFVIAFCLIVTVMAFRLFHAIRRRAARA